MSISAELEPSRNSRELHDSRPWPDPRTQVALLRRPIRFRWGDFELDEAEFELRKHGQVVVVQPKVLSVLINLLKNRDRVVDKQELLNAVWADVSVTEASLSQAVCLVRRAVDDSPETQHTIRTVRGKGFRFVAEILGSTPKGGNELRSEELSLLGLPRDLRPLGGAVADALIPVLPRTRLSRTTPYLFVVLHCDSLATGGSRFCLAECDEVILTCGAMRSAELVDRLGRSCRVALPDRNVSRDHAQIVNTHEGWVLSDENSANGSHVNGQRVRRRVLGDGDFIRIGHTLLWFKNFELLDEPLADCNYASGLEPPFASLLPELCLQGRDLRRIARSNIPVLLSGPTGAGKERTARAIHGFSGRTGRLLVLDAGARPSSAKRTQDGDLGAALRDADGGTLVLEHIELLAPETQSMLVRALDDRTQHRGVRFIATTTLSAEALASAERLRPDLVSRVAGYRCALVPLCQRLGDLGILVADLISRFPEAARELDPNALGPLLRYSWPGNLRELAHVLQIASTFSGGGPIGRKHLPPQLRRLD